MESVLDKWATMCNNRQIVNDVTQGVVLKKIIKIATLHPLQYREVNSVSRISMSMLR